MHVPTKIYLTIFLGHQIESTWCDRRERERMEAYIE